MDIKPGLKTSEFVTTLGMLATTVVALLVTSGVIAPQDHDTLADAVKNGITQAGALLASAAVIWKYIASRTSLKTNK